MLNLIFSWNIVIPSTICETEADIHRVKVLLPIGRFPWRMHPDYCWHNKSSQGAPEIRSLTESTYLILLLASHLPTSSYLFWSIIYRWCKHTPLLPPLPPPFTIHSWAIFSPYKMPKQIQTFVEQWCSKNKTNQLIYHLRPNGPVKWGADGRQPNTRETPGS